MAGAFGRKLWLAMGAVTAISAFACGGDGESDSASVQPVSELTGSVDTGGDAGTPTPKPPTAGPSSKPDAGTPPVASPTHPQAPVADAGTPTPPATPTPAPVTATPDAGTPPTACNRGDPCDPWVVNNPPCSDTNPYDYCGYQCSRSEGAQRKAAAPPQNTGGNTEKVCLESSVTAYEMKLEAFSAVPSDVYCYTDPIGGQPPISEDRYCQELARIVARECPSDGGLDCYY